MGEIAASALLSRITQTAKPSSIIYVDPELIVRETTTQVAAQAQASNPVIGNR
jgi:DNA-binding LacI/PurR family transcriptional regulator